MSHPNLSPDINAAIAAVEAAGGFYLKDIPVGVGLRVETLNTVYHLYHQGDGPTGGWTIMGHPKFCPSEVPANIHGSTFGGSMLKLGFVGVGMHLEFSIKSNDVYNTFTTSTIKNVEEV